jgi:hypothetical protein
MHYNMGIPQMETGSLDCNGDYDIILVVQAPEQCNYSAGLGARKGRVGNFGFLAKILGDAPVHP